MPAGLQHGTPSVRQPRAIPLIMKDRRIMAMDENRQLLEQTRTMLAEQEETIRFPHFTAEDAWSLGNFLVDRIRTEKIVMCVSIRRPDGQIIFQYMPDKTTLNNQHWLDRKFRTAVQLGKSSYAAFVDTALTGKDLRFHGLSEDVFALSGGAFPIRLTTGEMLAVVIVSGLPHEQDHAFLTKALKEWGEK